MTANDFNPGETWKNHAGRRLEILATNELDVDRVPYGVGVIAYRFHGMSMVHIRATADVHGWTKESE